MTLMRSPIRFRGNSTQLALWTLLGIATGASVACSSRLLAQIPDLQAKSTWYGEMDAGARLFRFVVTASIGEDGNWKAELKSLDEGGAKFELNEFLLSEDELSFELDQTKAAYRGQVKKTDPGASDQVEGFWTQGPAKLKLNFRKVDVAPVDSPMQTWIGEMQAGPQKLLMQFRIYQDGDQERRAYLDSVSQRVGGLKAEYQSDGDAVAIEVPSINGKFNGQLQADGKEIAGKWSQGVELDLTLRLAEQPVIPEFNPPKRPQNPKEPFPYNIQDVEFKNQAQGITFSGTLTIPQSQNSSQRFPVAILISGSGPQDRDETLLGHKPFWVLADYLTRRGIAVLRFDERGVGKSTGDFSSASTADFAEDVSCAVQFLASHDQIDPQKIGLIGHSEGGLVAPIVASQREDIAWIALMAGPGVNGEQIMYSQGKLMIEAEGGDDSAARRMRIIQEVAFREAKKLTPGESVDALVEPVTDEVLAEAKRLNLDTPGGEETAKKTVSAVVRANLQAMNTVWFRFFMAHEPGPVLEKVRCPVLAINGEKDTQVDPKLNLPLIEQSLKRGGNADITIVELPGLNHLFQTSQRGAMSEYETIEETLSPVALQTIGDWIEKRVKGEG